MAGFSPKANRAIVMLGALAFVGCAAAKGGEGATPAVRPKVDSAPVGSPDLAELARLVPRNMTAVVLVHATALDPPLPRGTEGRRALYQLVKTIYNKTGLDLQSARGVAGFADPETDSVGAVVVVNPYFRLADSDRGFDHQGVWVRERDGLFTAQVKRHVVVGTGGAVTSFIDQTKGAKPALSTSDALWSVLLPSGFEGSVSAAGCREGLALLAPLTGANDSKRIRCAAYRLDRSGTATFELTPAPGVSDNRRTLYPGAIYGPLMKGIDSVTRGLLDRGQRRRVDRWIEQLLMANFTRNLKHEKGHVKLMVPPNDVDVRVLPTATIGLAGAGLFYHALQRDLAARTGEAEALFKQVARRMEALVKSSGQSARFQFPESTGWSDVSDCCAASSSPRCGSVPLAHPTWKLLGLDTLGPHFFHYRFLSGGKGSGAWFVVEARADLNCNGRYSNLQLRGRLGPGHKLTTRQIVTDRSE